MEAWKLEKSAKCYNCEDATIHTILVNHYNLEIRCKECGFSRRYNFHMVKVSKENE